jgi:sphingomyelin phosphodiesterase acid-like 3
MAALLVIAWIAVSAIPAPAMAEPAVAGRALIVTDIHFNPMADPSLVDRLAAAEPRDWPGIFAGTQDRSLGHYLADTNWWLLRATLRQMKAVLPDPAAVLIPGDFLAHRFRRKFDAAARHHSDADYRAFVDKTMQFLTDQIADQFPGEPILPVIGNNDSDCGDYKVTPGGPFLAATLPLLRRLLGGTAGEDIGRDWSNGNYSVVLRQPRGLRVIVVDTVFFSPSYRNRCGAAGQGDPGKATIAWLAHRLEAARKAGARVWLAYHIPPGDDYFETFLSGWCPQAFVPLWKSAYAEPFYALMRQYAGTIAAAFAGHLHMDTFRLIPSGGFVLITPALSPIFGQNPAFRTVSFDRAGGLIDETTYDLTNLMGADAGPAGPPADWKAEYTFTSEWRLPRLDQASLARLAQRIATVPDLRRRWEKFYTVSSPASVLMRIGLAGDLTRAVLCSPAHLLPQDFDRCYCGARSR